MGNPDTPLPLWLATLVYVVYAATCPSKVETSYDVNNME